MDAIGPGPLRRGMTLRRALFDPLQPTDKPSWLDIRNMTGAMLDTKEISAGTDLTRRFVATMLERLDAGWRAGEFSSGPKHSEVRPPEDGAADGPSSIVLPSADRRFGDEAAAATARVQR